MPAPRRSRGERVPEGAEGRLAARRAVRCQAAVYGYQGCLRPHPHSAAGGLGVMHVKRATQRIMAGAGTGDRKSTRLNSSHVSISYAVFCLKKKKKKYKE